MTPAGGEDAPPGDASPPARPSRPAAPIAPGQVRVKLVVAYHGSGFRGFAAQPGARTVAGELAGAIERVAGHPVTLTCAGRTDAGVHAWGQVVHADLRPTGDPPAWGGTGNGVDLEDGVDLEGLRRSCTRMLGPQIVVRSAHLAPPGFDARRSARARRYRYTVLNRDVPDPFLASTTWHVEAPLDLRAMRLACDPVYGEHDFSSFCRRSPGPSASLVRVVREATWEAVGGDRLRFEVEATSFCQQMVRALVGTMVEVGRGRRRAGDMSAILAAGDRSRAGQLAPPHGLCLWQVDY